MRNFGKHDDYWKPCRPGTIFSVSDTKFRRQRRQFLIQATMGSFLGIAALFSAMFMLAHRKKNAIAAKSVDLSGPSQTDTNEEALAQRKGEPVVFTCEDIAIQLENYELALNRSKDERTLMQSDLLVEFERHMEACEDCRQAVARYLQNA